MAEEDTTVYLGDIQPSSRNKRPRQDDEQEETSFGKVSISEKRQRTLADMFSGRLSKTNPRASSATKAFTIPPGLVKLNSIPFSLSAYLDSMSEPEKKLLKLECDVMGKVWLKVLEDEIRKPYFLSLKEFLWKEGYHGIDDTSPTLKVYPPPRDIYAWSKTPLGKVKVVILGQDPYHGRNQAHGLCFSVPAGVAVPPSLRNIFTEIKAQFPEFKFPNHGNLEAWANNGVLLLNACLTVRDGDANSHSNRGWEQFTDRVLEIVDKYGGANLPSGDGQSAGFGRGVVFFAWGASAKKSVAKLNKAKHLILTSAHPSPYSADKGFFGNNHFRLANEWLEKRYGEEGRVNWCSL
ncbi:uracil-DNA glycosylase [Pholiota conissans]|uniref:Uracil-DNA glycosylase n=1 Tax=Pholiota conissans TaxID=109636 RepID=A0A9P5ZEA1_9AGAR|nr:uracil-DNA glycosylase [Pholiota conissans]